MNNTCPFVRRTQGGQTWIQVEVKEGRGHKVSCRGVVESLLSARRRSVGSDTGGSVRLGRVLVSSELRLDRPQHQHQHQHQHRCVKDSFSSLSIYCRNWLIEGIPSTCYVHTGKICCSKWRVASLTPCSHLWATCPLKALVAVLDFQ